MSGPLEPSAGGVRLRIHAQPGAAQSALGGRHGDALKVRVGAPAVDGAANRELVRFLAERLGVPRSRVELTSGLGTRRKTLLVTGLTPEQARRALGL